MSWIPADDRPGYELSTHSLQYRRISDGAVIDREDISLHFRKCDKQTFVANFTRIFNDALKRRTIKQLQNL